MKNIVLTSMTAKQIEVLRSEAKEKSMTITGLVKYWCQKIIDEKANKCTK